MHNIQRYILDKLVFAKYLRNRDMRPERVESNLYQYHLGRLIKESYIKKDEHGYTLDTKGLVYADTYSSTLGKERKQAKIVTTLVIRNKVGEVLLVEKKKQPFIGCLNLPSGKIHPGEDVLAAGQRELEEKTGLAGIDLQLVKTTYFVQEQDGETIYESYGFVLTGESEGCGEAKFVETKNTKPESLVPGVNEILEVVDSSVSHQTIRLSSWRLDRRLFS